VRRWIEGVQHETPNVNSAAADEEGDRVIEAGKPHRDQSTRLESYVSCVDVNFERYSLPVTLELDDGCSIVRGTQ
jgi:hypothetical protein